MVTVLIDELTPCLKDAKTVEIVQTEVIRIKRKSFLHKYNKKTQWYVNWSDLLDEHKVYALVIKGTVDIQGLIAIKEDIENKGIYIAWMCVSPSNNKQINSEIKYTGVGGHLFSIAMKCSIDCGYNGYVYGFAANQRLLYHYEDIFNAHHFGILHPYHFVIDDMTAQKVMEVYNYEWTDEEI